MEYGLIPNINQYRDNKTVAREQVQTLTQTSELSERNQLQEVQREQFLNASKSSEVEKTQNKTVSPKFEYTLSNTNFGFSNDSRDFFVKVARGPSENQFPTEDMMRLKSYIMSLDDAS